MQALPRTLLMLRKPPTRPMPRSQALHDALTTLRKQALRRTTHARATLPMPAMQLVRMT
ncbi:hypothetical protein [Burkholderia anthina]|uniref:hypothetical protein n=1 Tax=Burkholderia anthina TaxID=179879 RepID=UPI001FC8647B|nr:hypothetical protein [Burkholderia anthina]